MARDLPKDERQTGLFASDPEPVIEAEERAPKDRKDFDPDEILVRWSQEARSALEGASDYVCRVARFKNGKRGLQLIRGKDVRNPAFVSTLTLTPDEYYSLAQCIFRDSHLIRELCSKHPDGTEPIVDKIRDFVR
jgi:hypothetical protein